MNRLHLNLVLSIGITLLGLIVLRQEAHSFAANELVFLSHTNYFSSTYQGLDLQMRANPLILNRDLVNHYAVYLSLAENIPVNDVIRDFIHLGEFNGVRNSTFSPTVLNFNDYVRAVGLPDSVTTRFWNEYGRDLTNEEVNFYTTLYNIAPRINNWPSSS